MPTYESTQCAHVWANGNVQSGKNNGGSLYFGGRRIYSYGRHFVAGLRLPGRRFAITAEKYGTTTAKHVSYVWRAAGWSNGRAFPDLTGIAGTLEALAWAEPRLNADAERERATLAAYLRKNWQSFPADADGRESDSWGGETAGAYLFRLSFPRSRSTWAAMRAKLEREAARAAEQSAKRLARSLERDAAEKAAEPWPTCRARALSQMSSYGQRDLREMVSDYWKASRAAPKRHARVRAELWSRYKRLKAMLLRAEAADAKNRTQWSRYGGTVADHNKARAIIGKLRRLRAGAIGYVPGFEGPDGPDKLAAALALPNGSAWRIIADSLAEAARLSVHMPTRIRAAALGAFQAEALAIAEARETESDRLRRIADARRAALRELRTLNASRRTWAQGWPSHDSNQAQRSLRAIMTMAESLLSMASGESYYVREAPPVRERLARFAARLEAIRAQAEAERAPLLEAWEREREAARKREREAAERLALMSPAERLEAWRAGDLPDSAVWELERERGPLLRTVGAEVSACTVSAGELVTSQGARVPLRHAFRVFQFVAHCRAAGRAWKPGADFGPARIRVGHFSLDSVSPSGDFVAGCHAIKWPEIAALAERLGVADCMAEPETISGELETAA